jgi:hypothetical protein
VVGWRQRDPPACELIGPLVLAINCGTANPIRRRLQSPELRVATLWCADFAAWGWQMAGVRFTYGYGPGEINGAAASFYEWGVANGEGHPAAKGYVASPGDVAVYGLSLGLTRLPCT